MSTLVAQIGGRSYPIHIGAGLLIDGAALREALPAGRVLVVTDSNVAQLHLPTLMATLGDATAGTAIIEAGEANKDIDAWRRVTEALIAAQIARDGGVVALGGGMVCDVAGFAAATYLRGISIIHVPTTLLAQVDAAIGGKTAVDHPSGKNLIGAFHQPRAVIADTSTLATLDDRQYRSALAEVIKHAVIADAALFTQLELEMDALLQRDQGTLSAVINRCCEIKVAIVAADERESGCRAWLNLGHSFGHAIEYASGYAVLHGEAVGIGLVIAARLAHTQGLCSAQTSAQISTLVRRATLPVSIPEAISARAVAEAMVMDKKRDAEGLRLVLPEAIGRVRLVSAPETEALVAAIEYANAAD